MLKLSRAALLAASLSLAAPAILVAPTLAQEATQESESPALKAVVTVPTVTAVDSSMSESQIKELLTSNFLSHADDLARLTASSITIPELKLSFSASADGETYDSSATYRDIVITNVRDGYAEKVTVGSSVSVSTDGTTTYGEMTEDGFDIKRLLELVGLVKGDPAAAAKPIYNHFSMAGGTHAGPLYSCTIGSVSGEAFSAKANSVALSEVLALIEKHKDAESPPPEAIGTFVNYMSGILRGLSGGASSVGAIDCDVPGDAPTKFSIAGVATGGFEPAIYPEVKLGGIKVDAGALGAGSLGEFVLKSIDLNPTLNALEAGASQLTESWFDANWRLLIPSFGGFSLSSFAIDAVNPDKPGERLNAKIGNIDLSLGKYVFGVPTDISFTGSGIEVPLPEGSGDPQLELLRQAGITGVNAGFGVVAAWDEANSAINVEKIAFSALDLGSMSISAHLANATDKIFAVNPDIAMNAAFGVMVKDVTINVTDDGLGKIVWPMAAKEQGKTDVEAFRTEMAGFAEGLALQMLGSTDAARQLGASLGDFVTGRKGGVTITITSKDPNGIPLAYFVAAQNDPSILMGQIDVTGSAN